MGGPQAGWLRGIVKEVPSGDTVVVMANVKSGVPPEKRITLSSLSAPRLGRRDGSTRDDPFAWQSREFLRKLCAGKPCVFRVDYTLEAAGGREFGTVFINERDNAALASVTEGWAKVRQGGAQQSPYYEELVKAQEAAEARGAGMHTKDASALATAVREPVSDEFDAAGFLSRHGKGKSVQAIVEAVSSGSTLRVTLLPDMSSATVMVAGVQCPSMGRRPPAAAEVGGDGSPAAAASGPAAGTAAAAVAAGAPATGGAADASAPEPFAREARHFTELRCLNREVRLILEGVSQFGVLVASVQYPPASGAAGDVSEDLGTGLIKGGLGKAAEWSLNMMTSGAFKLREVERAARQARVGLWHSYVPPASNSAKLSDKFTGTVSEIASGDCLVVRDAGNGVERRVNISSIRAPRGPTRERPGEPWAAEAKEFLRQRLIGKEVTVSMEYTRKVPIGGPAAGPNAEERLMTFGTVTITEKSKDASAEPKVNNVAELLLVRGFAQVVKHRGDEERSAHYEDLMNAEDSAKKGKKGQWGTKEPPAPRVNDVTVPGSAQRARQHLPFLQRAGRVSGVCEFVLGGSRLKIHVPKEGVTLAFSPSGVRCPGRDEPFAAEALAYTRSHVLQRDVEIEVEAVDKAGTFLGNLRVPGHGGKPFNLSAGLLEAGLAKLHASFEPSRIPGGDELAAAQEKAKRGKLRLWEKYDPEAERAAADADDAAAAAAVGGSQKRETVEVTITDVTDANTFYVQIVSEARAEWIADELAGMSLDATSAPSTLLKVGDKCLAKFAVDGNWYRARIERTNASDPTSPQYDVFFLDFGNNDRVSASGIRPMPPSLAAVPAQANPAGLAFIQAPDLDADYGVEAAQRLSELVGNGRTIRAVVEGKERPAVAAPKGWNNAAAAAPAGPPAKLLLTLLLGDAPAAASSSAVDKVNGGGADDAADSSNGSSSPRPPAPKKAVSIPKEDYSDSVNCTLVAEGLARVQEPKRGRPAPTGEAGVVLDALKSAQTEASRRHIGLWLYGDPGGDSDDDGGFPTMNTRGGGGGKR